MIFLFGYLSFSFLVVLGFFLYLQFANIPFDTDLWEGGDPSNLPSRHLAGAPDS